MHYAAGNDSVDIQKYLVEKGGADLVDATTFDGWTPLFTACLKGHLASVQYLVSQGADPEAKETFQPEHNPRSLAQKKNHAAIVAFFNGKSPKSPAEQAVRTAMMNLSGDNKQKALADGTWGTLSWEERLSRLEGLGLITAAQSE